MGESALKAGAALAAIAAILVGASAAIGGMRNDLEAKTRAISALQADNREIRGLIFQHLGNHSPLAKGMQDGQR